MVQCDFKEKIESTNVMTGDDNKSRQLYYQLKDSFARANQIDIIVSFLMESGVKLILNDLKNALDRGVQIRILTGNYLGITQPSALYLLKKELNDRVEIRFYNEVNRSFHPKSYFFHYDDMSEMYIGSSNISKSALTNGIEWNYRFNSKQDSNSFNDFYNTFLDLYENHSYVLDDDQLKQYAKNWHKPAFTKHIPIEPIEEKVFEPRGAQIEALFELEKTREEGANRGLVQAATGVGKTYLAAFDSKDYKRVLFVAHREEILKQAAESFRNVRQSDDYGFFYNKQKDIGKSVIFASVATLGKSEYLTDEYFSPDYFDYVVVDEFHHAVNDQYMNIINYFKPKFLLGLTATPERMDGRNIYEICDYNVPYEITLKDAINRGDLVPFHYYGIYDETDYSNLRLFKGKYREKDLDEKYIGNEKRYDLIYKYYKKYKSSRALGFCSSRKHAEEMAKQFCKRGIKSVAVYSDANGEFSEERNIAINKLKNEEIQVIFSVDMFNEGVDIAQLDMVMFLRPTESPVVFLQQLGRGLRISEGKQYLNVLDFIGNYEKAGKAPFLLSGQEQTSNAKVFNQYDFDYPDDCIVDFDMRLIDLFREMDKRTMSVKEQIRQEYYKVKEILNGKVPTRVELFTYMETEVYEYCLKHSKENPFRQYLDFLHENNELTVEEEQLYNSIGKDFLDVIEKTDMVKVYKMPILCSFYNEGNIKLAVTDKDVLKSWKEFFDHGNNWKDFSANITYEKYKEMTDKQHLTKAKTMPIKFLKASGNGFFIEKEGYALAIRDDLNDVIHLQSFKNHMKDIIEYRTMDYYRRRYENRK
ncbi:DEAD/DEAH box helicase family protein [Floccifex sp.]|uniref:DEAD/DEAH box helicase family protein n=1 Tax=Floccifex sp. TaxID=2815810 RepID=UPI002A75874B|nr:DEAD/DEAH box helicase family protein [Floccifex sp.]MDD7281448.1 DEAD/DEAH box helicase family protein [Erysipelotrichaceae bacterium]MDY2957773.1 DEAD/DEAH box helicase family protein [Floccifex sp.]